MNMMIIDDVCEGTYSITELCNEFGLTPRTLRFYEQRKLLAPARRGSTRVFSSDDRARLRLIARAKRARFTLTEIKEMLDLDSNGNGHFTQLKVSLPKLKAQLDSLRAEHTELTDAIADLERSCALVEEMR